MGKEKCCERFSTTFCIQIALSYNSLIFLSISYENVIKLQDFFIHQYNYNEWLYIPYAGGCVICAKALNRNLKVYR